MLRENINTYNLPASDDLSVADNHEVIVILKFIDKNISGFHSFYLESKDSEKENRISESLILYFNACLKDEINEDFPPFNFSKNPTQPISDKETDIGVFVLTKHIRPVTIIEFEAKRLSTSANNKEYVCGVRGGMERFKRGFHAAHLLTSGMFGYIQSGECNDWIVKINNWITEQSLNGDESIDWKNINEKLVKVLEMNYVEKWTSVNKRNKLEDIGLIHYFINLN